MADKTRSSQSAQQPRVDEQRALALYWVIPAGLFGVSVASLFYLWSLWQTGAWQMGGMVLGGLVSLACLVRAHRLSRRQQLDAASYWVLASIVWLIALGELLSAGSTFHRLILGSVVLLLGGSLILPRRWQVWGGVTAGFAVYIGLINLWQPVPRVTLQTATANNPVGWVLIALATIALILRVVFFALHVATIRNRLRIAFMIVALLPGLIIIAVSVYTGFQSGEERVISQLESAAIFREELLARWLADLETDLLVEARRDATTLRRLLSYEPDSPIFESAIRVQQQNFANVLALRRRFEVLLVTDPAGRVILASESGAIGTTYMQAARFDPDAESVLYVMDYSSSLREAAIGVAVPLIDDATLIGYLVGEAPMRYMGDLIDPGAGLGDTGEVYLIEPDGFLLLTSLRSGERIPSVTTEGARTVVQTRQPGAATYLNYAREPVIGVYRWVPQLEVALLAEMQQAEVFGAIVIGALTNAGVLLAALGLAFIAATIVPRSIADPMTALADTARQIAEGDLTRSAIADREDELGALAQAFNRMTARLRDVIDGLEGRVAERTAALERRSAQLEAAARVSRQAASIRAVDELLEVTVQQISEQLGFYHAGLFLVDGAREYAVLRAASSEGGRAMLARGHRLEVGQVGIVGDVAQTGRARIALDVGEDAHFFDNPDLPETRSEMGLPLQVRDEIIGVLDVQSTESGAFSQEDVTYLQTMADQVALAIDNARLLAETERRLHEISRLLRSQSREGWQRMADERPTWAYIYDGARVRAEDPGALSEFAPQLVLPLRGRDEVIGNLKVALPGRPPTADELNLAESIVEQAGQALESARLFSETQTALEEVGILYRGSQAIGAANMTEEVLAAFVDYLVSPAIDRCVLALIEPDTPGADPMVRIEAAWERATEMPVVLGNRWRAAEIPLIAEARDEPVAIVDVTTAPVLDEQSRRVFVDMLHVRAVLIVPLVAAGRALGWLLVETHAQPYEFSEREIRLYRSLADQAAVVLQSIRLLAEATQRAEREQRVAEITAQVRASTDINTILRTSIRELGRTLAASEGLIRLKLEDAGEVPQTGPLPVLDETPGGMS